MSFNLNEPSTYINIKLTDRGRQLLSLGKLTFKKAVLSDREVDYGIDRSGYYNILSNRVLSPADFHPDIEPYNLDGSDSLTLGGQQVVSAKQFITADTPSTGFFTGSTNAWVLEDSKTLGKATIAYSSQTWNSTTLVLNTGGSNRFPSSGELVFIPWIHPLSGSSWTSSSIPSGSPVVGLWYKVISGSTPNITLDRKTPNFGALTGIKESRAYFYPNNGIENYYGSAQTTSTSVWNLNIVRTNTIAGTDVSTQGISGYTRYGSIQYNGTRRYFGFSSETPAVGFVHFTNEFTGNTYGEQLIEKSIQVFIPGIMWHNIGDSSGSAIRWGASFYDLYGSTIYDTNAKTTYRELRDGIVATSKVVGRVYHKLKLIVITDQELLTVLSYKSNRNYTLPDFNLNLTSAPKYPLTTSQATGLCKKDYTYFVSYTVEPSGYTASTSFGYPSSLHCGYIKKINGEVDINGNPQYLQLTFPSNAFPYLRSTSGMGQYGTGWNANGMQLLVSEQLTSLNYDVASVPVNSWKRVSTLSGNGGNGVYRAADAGDNTIDPLKINGHTFVISEEDYVSGATYTLDSNLTLNQDTLNFGDEAFFHGVIDLQIFATTYKSLITVFATNTDINSSINPTYDSVLDENTYISEIAILDDSNQVVAVGKPTYPVRKSNGRYLAFQLEIDF